MWQEFFNDLPFVVILILPPAVVRPSTSTPPVTHQINKHISSVHFMPVIGSVQFVCVCACMHMCMYVSSVCMCLPHYYQWVRACLHAYNYHAQQTMGRGPNPACQPFL